MAESLVRGLAAEGSVGSLVVVVVLPLLKLVVEDLGVVEDDSVEEPVGPLGVDAVGPSPSWSAIAARSTDA